MKKVYCKDCKYFYGKFWTLKPDCSEKHTVADDAYSWYSDIIRTGNAYQKNKNNDCKWFEEKL